MCVCVCTHVFNSKWLQKKKHKRASVTSEYTPMLRLSRLASCKCIFETCILVCVCVCMKDSIMHMRDFPLVKNIDQSTERYKSLPQSSWIWSACNQIKPSKVTSQTRHTGHAINNMNLWSKISAWPEIKHTAQIVKRGQVQLRVRLLQQETVWSFHHNWPCMRKEASGPKCANVT